MKLVSWNVNGLRACLKKGFLDSFSAINADIFCLQETKMHEGQAEIITDGYLQFWNQADKKGYSGTAVFSRLTPLRFTRGIGISEHDTEGRVITLEFDNFFLVNVYTPNSQDELRRLHYRMRWEDDFRAYLSALSLTKPLILCGDLNVAHTEIDLKNPKSNRRNPGFTDEERNKFSTLLDAGFIDSFRFLYPNKTNAYSWWSFRANARANNSGWRIDYFIVSDILKDRISDAFILDSIFGSDHCPVGLTLSV